MSKQNILLVNEHGQEIVGIKTTDGKTGKIIFTINIALSHLECLLPPTGLEYENGLYTFIFKDGREIKYKLGFILDCSVDHWMGI